MKRENAEIGAIRILGWLAAQDDLLPVFLGATGAGADDLRARGGDPDFLASMLDFVLMDDEWVVSCAEALSIPATEIALIRQALPGGALPNWT